MTAVVFVLGVTASFLLPSGGFYFGNSPGVKTVAFIAFSLMSVVVLGEFVLWFCMIWFFLRYFRGGLLKRIFSLVAQLLAFSLASAALYFFVYRRQLRRVVPV
jgi:hypothetical protein